LLDETKRLLGLKNDDDTTSDLSFTINKATCIGACSIAPVIVLNDLKGFEEKGEYTGFEYD
jgi:NADH:ubiquinone oxidoreductase subunit E